MDERTFSFRTMLGETTIPLNLPGVAARRMTMMVTGAQVAQRPA